MSTSISRKTRRTGTGAILNDLFFSNPKVSLSIRPIIVITSNHNRDAVYIWGATTDQWLCV